MQSDHKEIYKLTASRTGEPEQMYKDIGNFVFAELYAKLRKPQSLIIKLKGVGTWYLRKQRMELMVNMFPPDFDKNPEEFESKYSLLKYENKVELYNIFRDRLEDYKKYIEIRDNTRKIRYENQPLLEPPTGED